MRAGPLLLAACLASCAAPAPKPPPAAPVAAAAPVARADVDGTYRGTSTRYQASNRACPSPGLVTLHVEGRQFDYRWTYRVSVPVTIAPDGVLTDSDNGAGGITVAGHVTPGGIEGDVTTPACALHFTVRRRVSREQG